MFWIDKNNKKNRKKGHKIVNQFLQEAWNTEEGKYINCTFDSFKRGRNMERLLHEEQNGFCCYCMRHLEIGVHTSLEHIIPHHCENDHGKIEIPKINYYKQFNEVFKKVEYVHLTGETHKRHIGSPYPHFCAYENLVLSCDGSLFIDEDQNHNLCSSKLHLCCNEARGSEQIVPLFFIPNIHQLVEYNDNGEIKLSMNAKQYLSHIDFYKTIEMLKLDCDRLSIIRRVWNIIAIARQYGIEQVKSAIYNPDLREEILAISGVPFDLAKRVNHHLYWKLLSEYYWFYLYYINKEL